MKNLVYVPLERIPDDSFELYEVGEYRENIYYNKDYHIKIEIDSDRITTCRSDLG